ncbi:MAG TPA: nuclear transport factor 2 family protein [Geobacteraceae bacterium]|nr:nuclear transport factor 2 family protein [Geobacteraceae bacterium]
MGVHRVLAGMVLICFAVVSPCLAENAGAKLTGQVTALLQKQDVSLNAHDVKGVMKTYLAGPEIILMGTGPGEVYRGVEGVEGAYSQFFTRFEKGTLSIAYDWVSAGSREDLGWFAAEGTIKAKIKEQMKEIGFNMSGTLIKQKGGWRFVIMHFSRLGVSAESAPEAKK